MNANILLAHKNSKDVKDDCVFSKNLQRKRKLNNAIMTVGRKFSKTFDPFFTFPFYFKNSPVGRVFNQT